ncbi:MAG: YxiJ family protein [Blastocatellia bacterium]
MALPASSIVTQDLTEQAAELRRVFKEDLSRPFPYQDCRKVFAEAGDHDEGFIPDLDLYWSDLAGYCSWGKGILGWPEEKLSEVKRNLEKSFLDRHPQHQKLVSLVTENQTPDLYGQMAQYEDIRATLLQLISELLK